MNLLQEIVVLMFCSVGVLMLFSKAKVPSILGFILTGIFIGPSGLNLVSDTHAIELFAEVGVMLLMFTIGMEFSLDTIKKMKFEVLVLGGLQIALTLTAVTGIGIYLGYSTSQSLLAAFVLSLSSTAIVIKLLHDQQKLQTPYGRIMVGILLFQDICIVPMMILTPFLTPTQDASTIEILLGLLKAFSLMTIIFFGAKYLLPKVFDFICSFRIREIFLLLILALCFGLSMLTARLGFSLAMGSFIAGMILAESQYFNEIENEIKPLRNIFISFFFVSIGLLLDLGYLSDNYPAVMAGVGSIILLKVILVFVVLRFAKYPPNIAIVTALGIAQIGEFSFLILNLARQLNIVPLDFYQYLLAITIISMLITPLLLYVGSKLAPMDILKKKVKNSHSFSNLKDHVVIGGFGMSGQRLAKIFKVLGIEYSIIEMNPNTVKKYKDKGENIIFGDITSPDNLSHLGIERASLFVIALSDNNASLKAVELAKGMGNNLHIIVRTEYSTQIEDFYAKGANAVVSQDFEAAIGISSQALKFLGIADRIARIQGRLLRNHHYEFFSDGPHKDPDFKLIEMTEEKEICDLYLVRSASPLIGKTLKQLDFTVGGKYLNVIILGVVRKDELYRKAKSFFIIEEHDTLILYGGQNRMDEAILYLDHPTEKTI